MDLIKPAARCTQRRACGALIEGAAVTGPLMAKSLEDTAFYPPTACLRL